VNVVIFDKHEIIRQLAAFAQLNDLLNEAFAFVVPRVRLAGEDELNRPLLVMDEFYDVFKLPENQWSALIGGEPAGEANGQRVWIQQMLEADEVARP